MIERAFVHVLGPTGAGKTSFVESILAGAPGMMLAARCVRDDSRREPKEWAPKEDPELKRYRAAGAAGLVVVNVRTDAERKRGERLVAEVHRLRKDEKVFEDVLGWSGSRIPITAVVADVTDPDDAGVKKALARVRRAVRAATRR